MSRELNRNYQCTEATESELGSPLGLAMPTIIVVLFVLAFLFMGIAVTSLILRDLVTNLLFG